MAKRTRREAFRQAAEAWQQFSENLQAAQQRWNRWLDEELPSESTGEQAPQRTLPAKRGGGRTPILTDDEIRRLRAAYPTIRAESRNQATAFAKLRKLLPPDKRRISDTALRVHVIPPTAPK